MGEPSSSLTVSRTVTVVMGNQASDADSMVSSIVYAYCLHWDAHQHKSGNSDGDGLGLFIPMMPIPRADFALRFETAALFDRLGIDPARHLLFADELEDELEALHRRRALRLVLTDHNRLKPGKDYVLNVGGGKTIWERGDAAEAHRPPSAA